MNFLKQSALMITVLAFMGFSTAQANEEVNALPTIHVMAESELREEVGFAPVPFQERKDVQQALQHHLYKIENGFQNNRVEESVATVDYQPQATAPDLSQYSPVLQQYILAVAAGLQSSDPTNGLFKMLEPLNINRNNADDIRDGAMKVNIDDLLRLQQQIRDGLIGQ